MKQVECATHGSSSGALVCGHLHEGEGLGFHYEAEREPDCIECPDAWCDDCHVALEAEDEWTDTLVEQADFKLVCSRCYGHIRARNWAQDDEAYEALVDSSTDYLQAQQEVLTRDFKLGEHARWDFDQERAQLTFSNDGRVAVICDVLFVGSIATASRTWLWSWANESVLDAVKIPMTEVRTFGEERGFERLAGAFWDGEEADGWEMTAIAAKFLGAIGAYRSPKEQGFTFMVITAARWAQ